MLTWSHQWNDVCYTIGLLRDIQRAQRRRARGDCNLSTDPITIFSLRTGHCTCSGLAWWTLLPVTAKKQNGRSTTFPRTVPSGGNRDTSHSRRMRQSPTSCGEWRKTCAAPSSSWLHVDWAVLLVSRNGHTAISRAWAYRNQPSLGITQSAEPGHTAISRAWAYRNQPCLGIPQSAVLGHTTISRAWNNAQICKNVI